MASRTNQTLLSNVSAPTGASRKWIPTAGRIYSVDACLDAGATAAVINIYGANSNHGLGTLICTLTLSVATTSDGTTFSDDDGGWFFVAAELVSSTGAVKSVSTCVEKD